MAAYVIRVWLILQSWSVRIENVIKFWHEKKDSSGMATGGVDPQQMSHPDPKQTTPLGSYRSGGIPWDTTH